MNKQFQEDIKFAHKLKKEINKKISMGEVSIKWIDFRESLNDFIKERRFHLIKKDSYERK